MIFKKIISNSQEAQKSNTISTSKDTTASTDMENQKQHHDGDSPIGDLIIDEEEDFVPASARKKREVPLKRTNEIGALGESYINPEDTDMFTQTDAQRMTAPFEDTPKRPQAKRVAEKLMEKRMMIPAAANGNVNMERKRLMFAERNATTGVKYQKIDCKEGRILDAFFTPSNEDILSTFTPLWMHVGNPTLAKEMICIR